MASKMINPSLVLHGKGDIRLEETPIPVPKDDEVLIKSHTVGICGTDMHLWKSAALGDLPCHLPFVLGHEASGVVAKLGKDVTHLKEGDHICVELMVPCEKCTLCKGGNYHVCKSARWAGIGTDGFLRKYSVHRASYCFKLPETMNIEHGAFMEPLSCALYACERAEVKANSRVLITGAGPISIAAAMVAKGMGAAEVCLTGTRQARLHIALGTGRVDHTVLCDTSDPYVMCERVVEKLGQKADMTIECTGTQSGLMLACLATENAGIVSLLGLGGGDTTIPIDSVALRGIQLRGISKYNNSFPGAIHLASTGVVDVDALITHRFPIDEAMAAFQLVADKTELSMKVLIQLHSD